MEFEELTNIWRSADEELKDSMKINKELLKQVSMNKIKSGLYDIKWDAILEIVISLAFLDFIWDFTWAHTTQTASLIPGLIILGATITTLVFDGYKLYLLYGIGTSRKVVETQKRLAHLQYVEQLDVNLLLLFMPLLAAPFVIVGAKAFIGIQLYIWNPYMIYLTIGSFGIAIILVFILKMFPNKKLKEAIAFLQEIREEDN